MKHILFLAVSLSVISCSDRTPKINAYNTDASLPDTLLLQPHEWKVITSHINKTAHTMSTLYGNDVALKAARSGQGTYPAGALLSLVTWKQQPDDHWFGALIPGAVESVEQVLFAAGNISPVYTKYTGNQLTKSAGTPDNNNSRTDWIIRQRAAVMP